MHPPESLPQVVAPPLYSPRKLRERGPALGSLCGGFGRAPLPDNWGGDYKYHLSLSESDWLRLVLIIPPDKGKGKTKRRDKRAQAAKDLAALAEELRKCSWAIVTSNPSLSDSDRIEWW